jgi:CheY-specific phosphatase CheX
MGRKGDYFTMDQLFGHYLLNKGILSPSQLSEVLQQERKVKVKLGVLAVNAGFMTAAQVEEVHNLQRVKDQKFGVLAISQGYLTEAQVDNMLSLQHEGHLALIQAIADIGYMTMSELETALANFRCEHADIHIDSDAITEDELVRILVDFSAAGEKADLLYDYVGLLLRNIVRFLNETPFILANSAEIADSEWLVSQQIVGAVSLTTRLHMNDRALLEIASRFYGEPLANVNELALDCAGEFLNVHNGIWSGSLSNAGYNVDLLPQSYVKQTETTISDEDFRILVGTSFGNFEIILSLNA